MFRFLLVTLVYLTSLQLNFASDKIGSRLKAYFEIYSNIEPVKVWIYFTDKGNNLNRFYNNPELVVGKESLERRRKVLPQHQLIDYDDVPVNENYINTLKNFGIKIKHRSKWFNSVSAFINKDQLNQLITLPFVQKIELVERFRKKIEPIEEENIDQSQNLDFSTEEVTGFNYGQSLTQNQQINVVAVHNTGNYGQGVRVCLMDAGFNRLSHEVFQNMNIIATWDFVNGRPYVGDGQGGAGSGSHGTQTLSTIGGFKEGQLIGPAFGATYLLAKTENTESETPIEMDNWIAALEWADSIGVDVTSTSLGYLEFDPPYPSYNWTHMNGNNVPITIAADLAAKRGIVVVNSAGNEGFHLDHNTLVAPADGDSVIAVGAVTSTGSRASFSSVGNTVDGRIKPDVMAMGSGVRVASPYSDNGYTSSSGTSFSCPLAAGVAALILSENPSLTPIQVRDAMRNTASNANNPDRLMGWGILNALQAVNYYNINFAHTPPTDSTNLNGPYRIAVKITSRLGIDASSVKLFWGRGTITDSILMTEAPGDTFYAFIPGNGQSAVYKYYIEARTLNGEIIKRYPKRAPQELLEFRVGNFVSLNFSNGWNLMSVPALTSNLLINQLFPNTNSNAYYYDGRYIVKDTILPGYGFWLKFSNMGSTFVPGTPLTAISIPVKSGWNLIGSLNTNVPVYTISSVPGNIILTPFYGYNSGYYNSPQIERGKGYWVKVLQDGYLILNSQVYSTKPILNPSQINELILSDAAGNSSKLYLSDLGFDSELPPLPPANNFDIRFSDSKVATLRDEDLISLQGVEYPLRITLSPKSNLSIDIFNYSDKNFLGKLNPGESLVVNNLNSNLLLIKVNREILQYELSQNYPNPFNSSTIIKFQIPERNKIIIKLFDILGREITTVANDYFEAGHHSLKIDSEKFNNLPSGMYIYTLTTNKFKAIRKLMYIK